MRTKQRKEGSVPAICNADKIYQRIGEFVVCFQWLENRFREIGWLILDPHRKEWPPKSLHNESNSDLILKVEKLYVDLIDRLGVENHKERKDDFRSIVAASHRMRKYRNNLLHSAFIELEAGGDLVGILRSNPKIKTDAPSGETLFDQEIISERAILKQMEQLGKLAVSSNSHYMQLIHWAPFDRRPGSHEIQDPLA
jgi:hypothetical protein